MSQPLGVTGLSPRSPFAVFSRGPGRRKTASRQIRTHSSSPRDGHVTVDRRQAIGAVPASWALLAGPASWQLAGSIVPSAHADESLAQRLRETAPLVPTGRLTPPWAQQTVLYVPQWMLGTWEVTSTSVGFSTPQGPKFVPPGASQEAEAEIGSSVKYSLRFKSVQEETGGLLGRGKEPKELVVADRAANIRSVTNAFQGYDALSSVEYDAAKDPSRVTAKFSQVGPDMRPLPPQKIEVYINHIESQECWDGESRPNLYTSELFRQVFVGVRRVEVNDYEICMGFTFLEDGVIRARQRNIVYLQPQDAAYFDAGGRSVAFYDYDLEMRRTSLPEGITASSRIVCVGTPKPCA